MLRLPKNLFAALVDDARLDHQQVKTLALAIDELITADTKLGLVQSASNYPLVSTLTVAYAGLLIGWDKQLVYLPTIDILHPTRLEYLPVIRVFESPVVGITVISETIRVELDGGAAPVVITLNTDPATVRPPQGQSGITPSILDPDYRIEPCPCVADRNRLMLRGNVIDGSELSGKDQAYTDLFLLSQQPLRLLTGGKNVDAIHYLTIDPMLSTVIETRRIAISPKPCAHLVCYPVANPTLHQALLSGKTT